MAEENLQGNEKHFHRWETVIPWFPGQAGTRALKQQKSGEFRSVRSASFGSIRRDSDQNIDTDRLSCFHRRFEGPAAERQFCGGVHFVRETLKNLEVCYYAVFPDSGL